MALLDEILAWSTSELKPWQSDAVRRLFLNHELVEEDFRQLLDMLKRSKGFEVDALAPAPLLVDHLPTFAATGPVSTLAEIRELKSVNRLAPDSSLFVGENGATVIYGDNGSGKSGFSRVIKSACRARVKGEPVLGDVQLAADKQGRPSATFRIKAANDFRTVVWEQGVLAPKELAHVAIFDSKCARAYTDSEGDLIFLPWGLEVVDKLARVVFPEIERRVQQEINAIDVSTTAFQDLFGPTKVGDFFRTLSASTDAKKFEALASISEQEVERLQLLEKTLAEKDPIERAKRTHEIAGWFREAAVRIQQRSHPFSDASAQSYESHDKNAEEALLAEKAAAAALRSGEYLIEGTGDRVWKSLFLAAAEFATSHNHSSPSVASPGETCVLCQQALDENSAARLRRFGDFVRQDVSRQASSRVSERNRVRDELSRQAHLLDLQAATLDLIQRRKPEIAEAIQQYESSLAQRKAALLSAFGTHGWRDVPQLVESPAQGLKDLAEQLEAQAVAIAQIANPAKKVEFEKEKAELDARCRLIERKEALTALLGRVKDRAALGKCLNDLKTRPISTKAIALTQNSVTHELTVALNEEFQALGISSLKAKIVTRIEQGRPKVKLSLDIPGNARPEQVLSEGEQRAVAIASFLAELRTAKHFGPLIFDDPVSSLDHRRRMSVAERLIEEAKHRQVLIFTHDAVFLAELLRIAKKTGVPLLTQHLGYTPKSAGIVREGLPWVHLPYNDRLDKLEKRINSTRRDWDNLEADVADTRIREIYALMREICERIVQDVAFESVIERFNSYIRVPNLIKVAGLELGPCTSLVGHWQKASDITLGHDKASAQQVQLPTAEEALADLTALRATVADFKKRHSAAKAAATILPAAV